MKDKKLYVTPSIMVVEVKTEGILCASGDTSDGTGRGFSEGWDS